MYLNLVSINLKRLYYRYWRKDHVKTGKTFFPVLTWSFSDLKIKVNDVNRNKILQ